MNDSPDTLEAASDAAAASAPAGDTVGWYLYGITRAREEASDGIGATMTMSADDGEPVETIFSGSLLAVVRRVPVNDFSAEALSARAEDPAWIEMTARRHNAVIEAVHRTRTILPAKFGCVYACADDVRAALREEHDALLASLHWLDGCDEWGVRLHGDVATIRQRADLEQESVQRLRYELSSATPGRAFFLQRKVEEELANAVDHLLDDLIEHAYAEFAHHARAGQVTRLMTGSQLPRDEETTEILRAAFLVPHEVADVFVEDVRRFSQSQPGLWSEYSGPWPPYSFAAHVEQAARSEEA